MTAGSYKMTLKAFGTNANGAGSGPLVASVYAGETKGESITDGKTLDNTYSVNFNVSADCEMNLGVRMDEGNGANWVGANDMKLYKLAPETMALKETDEVYLDADGEPFRPDMIVVDGVSLLYVSKQQSIVEFSKKRATVRAAKNEVTGWAKEVAIEGAGLEMKDYNTLKFEGQNLLLNLLSCGKHFAITMREEDEKVQIKDEKTKEYKTVPTGRKRPQGFKDVVYNVKTVIRLFKDTDGLMKGIIENKDRMKVYQQDEVIVEPSILAWQSVIDKNKGRKASVLTGTLKDSVKKEVQAIEEENGKINDDYEESEKSSKKLSTVEDYQVEIKQTLSKLTQVEKSKKLAELEENKLPKNYGSLNEIELLKKYLNIISN